MKKIGLLFLLLLTISPYHVRKATTAKPSDSAANSKNRSKTPPPLTKNTNQLKFGYSFFKEQGYISTDELKATVKETLSELMDKLMGKILASKFMDPFLQGEKKFANFKKNFFNYSLFLLLLYFFLSIVKKTLYYHLFTKEKAERLAKSIYLECTPVPFHFFFPWQLKRVIKEMEKMDLSSKTLFKIEQFIRRMELYIRTGQKPPHLLLYGNKENTKLRRNIARILARRFRRYQVLSGYFLSLAAKKDLDILHKVMAWLKNSWLKVPSCTVIDEVEVLHPRSLETHLQDHFLIIGLKRSDEWEEERSMVRNFRYAIEVA